MDNTQEQALRQSLDEALEVDNMNLASSRLDELLRFYVKNNEIEAMLSALEDIVENYSDEWSFRWRLSSLYERLGRINDAIHHLDVIGEQMRATGDEDGVTMVVDKLRQLRGE